MSMMNRNDFAGTVNKNVELARDLLCQLIEFPTTRGNGQEISPFLTTYVEKTADSAELVPVPESIVDDPDYSFRLENFSYDGAANVRARINGLSECGAFLFGAGLGGGSRKRELGRDLRAEAQKWFPNPGLTFAEVHAALAHAMAGSGGSRIASWRGCP